jgi:archaellin
MQVKVLVAACAIVAMIGVGCSSSSKSSSTSSNTTTTVGSGKEPVCVARANLKKSVTALADPSLLTSGKSGIQSALDTVKTDLDAVATSAGDVYKPDADAVRSAVDDLQTAVSNLGDGSATQNLQAVGTAITKVGSTAATLISSLQAACPSG